jgi:hypothetical protein
MRIVPRYLRISLAFLAIALLAQTINYFVIQKDGTISCGKGDAYPRYFFSYRRNFLSLRGHFPAMEAFDPFAAAYAGDSVTGQAKLDQILQNGYECSSAPANPGDSP